jgi:hypothetical protein
MKKNMSEVKGLPSSILITRGLSVLGIGCGRGKKEKENVPLLLAHWE